MPAETLVGLVIPLVYLVFSMVEARFPARRFEEVPHWRRTGALFFLMVLVLGSVLPLLVPAPWLQHHALLNLSGWGLWGAPVGVLATTFLGYWLHRAEHRFGWLWRVAHQLHHSPRRVDMAGAYFTHPVEVVLKVLLGLVVGGYVLGLSPLAMSVASVLGAVLSMWQHWNIRTPHWLGYWVARPESHVLHHASQPVHRNFGDLPVWDMLFGTFDNPHAPWTGPVGFDAPRHTRLKDMLRMKDVNHS